MIKLSFNQWLEIGKSQNWLKEAVRNHALQRIQLRSTDSSLVSSRVHLLEKQSRHPGLYVDGIAADILDLVTPRCVKLPEKDEYTCGDMITAILRPDHEGQMDVVTVTYRRSRPELYKKMETDHRKKLNEILNVKNKIFHEQPLTPDYFRVAEVLTLEEVDKWLNGIMPFKIFKHLSEPAQNKLLAEMKEVKQKEREQKLLLKQKQQNETKLIQDPINENTNKEEPLPVLASKIFTFGLEKLF